MLFLFSCIFLIIFSCIFYSINKKYKKINMVGAYSGFAFSMGLYYCIIPFLIILLRNKYLENINAWGYSDIYNLFIMQDEKYYVLTFIFILIGWISFNFSYNIKFNIRKQPVNHKLGKIELNSRTIKVFQNTAYVTFIIGFLSLIIYIVALGGLSQALNLAETLRSFSSDTSLYVSTSLSIFKYPARFVTVSSYILFFLMLNRKKNTDKYLFILSFILSLIYYLINAGRANLIIYLFVYVYIFLKKRFKKTWLKILVLGIVALPLLDILDQVFVYFETNESIKLSINLDRYVYYISEFDHPIKVLMNCTDIADKYSYFYFRNVITDVIGILPKIGFDQTYYNTSEFFLGKDWMNFGGIPNDVLSFGYLNLNVVGIFIVSVFWGKVMRFIDNSILSLFPDNLSRDFWGIVIASNVFSLVSCADIQPILMGSLLLMTTIFIVLKIKNRI